MSTETGSLVTVYVARAGGTLAGDHPTGSTQLAVTMGWDFEPTGGSLSIAGTVYDYTSAVVQGEPLPELPQDPDDEEQPDPDDGWDEQTGTDVDVDEWLVTENDDRPTIIALTTPLGADAADGDLVALEPESITKTAEVQLADFDETIQARIPHHLMDRVAEGSRGDLKSAETVAVRLDDTTWIVDDVMGKPVAIDASAIDPTGPQLPAPVVPGVDGEPDLDDPDNPEGSLTWTGSYYVERMRSGHMQADVAVAGNLWVARYADETDPNSGPAENSAVIEQNPDDGFVVWSPKLDPTTGQWVYGLSDPDNPESEMVQVRDRSVHFPAAEYEYDQSTNTWQRIAAKFAGEVDAEHLRVSGELEINGTTTVAPSSSIRLENAVNDPTDEPTIMFAPKLRSFPSGKAFEEIGLGRSDTGTLLVCGRAAPDPNGNFYNMRARFVSPNTGRLDRDTVNSFPFFRVGGFTSVNGRHYVLCKFASHQSPWTIVELGPQMGTLTGNNVNVNHLMQDGLNAGCLGDAGRNDTVAFAYRDNQNRVGIRYYNLNLTNNPDIPGRDTGYVTTRPMRGVPEVGVVAAGTWVFHFNGADINLNTSWVSGAGQIAGICRFPGTGFMSIHNNGTLAVHNDQITVPTRTDFSYTKTRTNVNPIRQTRMSPTVRRTWPVRKFATVQAPSPTPGTNDTYLYAGAAAGRTSQFRLAKPAGQAVTTIDRIPTSGTNPPATSGFSAVTETPALLDTQATIPGTTRPAALIDAAGNAELYGLRQASIRYRHLGGPTIQSGGATALIVPWDTADQTSTDIPYTAAGTWTIQLTGTYLITAQVSWIAASTTQGYRQISVMANGETVASGMSGGATNVTACSVTAMPQLNRNDTIQIRIIQNSGTALALRTVGTENYVSILRIGA